MKKFALLFVIALVSACTTITQNNGAEVRQINLDQVTADSTKTDVFKLLGSPSTKSVYGDETWYYITSKVEKQLVQDDQILTQSVLAISFEKESEKVSNLEIYGTNDKREFATSDRVTPTAGRKLTVIEQILGNVGKFNTESMSAATAGGSRAPGGGRY